MDKKLTVDTITFGKYRGLTLSHLLKDRNYCKWLIRQEWFEKNYSFLFNRIKEYNPRSYFVNDELKLDTSSVNNFISSYIYFHLTSPEELKIELEDDEKCCYSEYIDIIDSLKEQIVKNQNSENPFNIKAPRAWLKKFEAKTNLSRTKLKDFISAYELPNLPIIIEDIKKAGGLTYNGGKSWTIAKKRSEEQEAFWEKQLKKKYGEDIGTQFKFKNCIFDAINIKNRVLYECKLGFKDFNEDQYRKYLLTLGTSYQILYLIGREAVVDVSKKIIFTSNLGKTCSYTFNISSLKDPNKFDLLIKDFKVVETLKITSHI